MKNLILTLVLSLFVSISFSQNDTLKYTINNGIDTSIIAINITSVDFIDLVQDQTTMNSINTIHVLDTDIIMFINDNILKALLKNTVVGNIDDEFKDNNKINDFTFYYYLDDIDNDTLYLIYEINNGNYIVRIVLDGYASTDELVKEDIRLSVYPNPVRDIVNVEFTTTQRLPVELYTLSGQLILSETNTMIGDNKVQLNMYDLPSGMYLIKVGNETFRTVKQ